MPGRRPDLRVALALAGIVLAAACAPNDPFDPESLENLRPTVGMFVASPDTGELPPTSYYQRTFHWHATDQDGWVVDFDVSIRLDDAVPAPWVQTTRTDTTMTFATDDEGRAEATFYIVARDNRGGLSDTLRQYFPLQNLPPEINFAFGFDPLANLQREVVPNGAASDTLYWNWGFSNFKFTAYDADGAVTMDRSYRYTFATDLPAEEYWESDSLADPETTWVRAYFTNANDLTSQFKEFEIVADGLAPGLRTLTVEVDDEADATGRFSYGWDVRSPRSNILYIADNTSSIGRECYGEFLDGRFGSGNWDQYDFWKGYPDRHATLVKVMRLYDAVLWTDGGVTSGLMRKASERGGALESYVFGDANGAPGRFMLISAVVAGNTSDLGANLRLNGLGINAIADPQAGLTVPSGRQAQSELAGYPPMTSAAPSARAIGLDPYAPGEVPRADVLYRLEECIRCYNNRPPYDPIFAVRTPVRAAAARAATITIGGQLEYFDRAGVIAALNHLFDVEMEVARP